MNLEFRNTEQKYVQQALNLAIQEYKVECEKCPDLIPIDFSEKLRNVIQTVFSQNYGKVVFENGEMVGYLAFQGPWYGFHGNVKGVFSPLGGSAFAGTNRNMLASKLFQEVATDMVRDGICSFALSQYAHDEDIGTAFVMNGFGIRCSDAIMKLDHYRPTETNNDKINYLELDKNEKYKVQDLKIRLAKHLFKAPTFFPTDFSKFERWLSNDDIRVFVAENEQNIIGYMAINTDAETFVSENDTIYNICGAYVDNEYRSTVVAKKLLDYVWNISLDDGMSYLGVDCETLNPNALRFWSKYFTSYTYSYARRIDERVLGYDRYLKEMWK